MCVALADTGLLNNESFTKGFHQKIQIWYTITHIMTLKFLFKYNMLLYYTTTIGWYDKFNDGMICL